MINERVKAQLDEVRILTNDVEVEAEDGMTKMALESAKKLQIVVEALVKILKIDVGK